MQKCQEAMQDLETMEVILKVRIYCPEALLCSLLRPFSYMGVGQTYGNLKPRPFSEHFQELKTTFDM